MEKVFSVIRRIYDRKPTDDLKDLGVNPAIWSTFMSVTLQAAVHIGRDWCFCYLLFPHETGCPPERFSTGCTISLMISTGELSFFIFLSQFSAEQFIQFRAIILMRGASQDGTWCTESENQVCFSATVLFLHKQFVLVSCDHRIQQHDLLFVKHLFLTLEV